MSENSKLTLFISYSHNDESLIKEFIKHLAPLENNGTVNKWYDRKIIAGQDFQNTIDNNLDNADVICLLISSNFLSSTSCLKEKNKAIELYRKKGVSVLPIILSDCGWLDDQELSPLLALPTDGKPISNFSDANKGWKDVYDGLKLVLQQEKILNELLIKPEFEEFLNNAELLTKAHSEKESVTLEDIFVYPTLIKFDDLGEYEKKENSEQIIQDFLVYPKILIAGEGQSGKTTLCKKIFLELRKKKYIPIYISLKQTQRSEHITKRITEAFSEQYNLKNIDDFNPSKLVPIIDDLQHTNNLEKSIQGLDKFYHQVIMVDDIFRMNIKDESIIKKYSRFNIKELSPAQRNELIIKWAHLTDLKNHHELNENHFYKIIDQKTELVDNAIGRVLGRGIMPAYPFFILSVISTYEAFQLPLDQEITSQGHCYQALIYLYLRKEGVKNDEVDTFFNFLTEFSFYLFENKKRELSPYEFNQFMEYYLGKFNLPIKKELLLKKLQLAQIVHLDSLGNYSFFYPYLYYYFVAKYLAEHCTEKKDLIDGVINNLHKNENAYIAIFLNHHSKNFYVLDEILLNAMTLFDKNSPTTLSKKELSFFDNEIEHIVKESLPTNNSTPAREREDRLQLKESVEEDKEKVEDELDNGQKQSTESDELDELAINLRRSIKTVEVMGQIIKNRAGSLEKNKLSMIFEEAMNVHLRILSSFFEILQNKEGQEEIVEYISSRLSNIIKDSRKKPDKIELDKLSRLIFWNMNFSVVYTFMDKIIRSLGSDKLINIVNDVCNKINTPATFLIKHGVSMWYDKNLQIDTITDKLKENEYSEISKKIMKFIIVDHASMHVIDYKDKQRIADKLGIPTQNLLIQNIQKK